jgi:tetratricopeptide (TPR) repeat protein
MAYTDEELEQYRRELASDPTSRRFVPFAEMLRQAGALDEAEAVLSQGLEHHPNLRPAHVVRARIWRDQGHNERSLGLMAELYPQDAGNVALTELYCELLIELGHFTDADEVLRRAQYTGFPEATRVRLAEALGEARFPRESFEAEDVSSLGGVLTLPGLYLEELGDPFALPIVAARVGSAGNRKAAKNLWREVARLHPSFSTRANREITRLDGIAARAAAPDVGPVPLPGPRAPRVVAAAVRAWADKLGLDV